MSNQEIAQLGDLKELPISALLLDDQNPRLPKSQHGQDQSGLAVVMEMGFDAYTVAENISRFGYFASEPLIAIPVTGGKYCVVEGNRRLTALLGLTNSAIRKEFATPERWEVLAKDAKRPGLNLGPESKVPVVIAPDRESVVPVIGWRHVNGILQWEPFAQARYVASLIDGQKLTFEEVAHLIGKRKNEVAALYRDQAIADQAKAMGIDTGNLEQSFSLLQVAMSSTKIREFVGAPLGGSFEPGSKPIAPDKKESLAEVLGYIYGNGDQPPVINDSRQISALGNVIAEQAGLKALREGESLDLAKQRIADVGVDPRERLLKRLRAARNSLVAAFEDYADFTEDPEVSEIVGEILESLRDVESSN
jgi:hypothetical protein